MVLSALLPSHIVILSVSEGSSFHPILEILRAKALRMTETFALFYLSNIPHLTSSPPSPRKRRMPLSGVHAARPSSGFACNDKFFFRHPRAGGDPEPPARNSRNAPLRRSEATVEGPKPFKSANELSDSRLRKINSQKKCLKPQNELNKHDYWKVILFVSPLKRKALLKRYFYTSNQKVAGNSSPLASLILSPFALLHCEKRLTPDQQFSYCICDMHFLHAYISINKDF